MSDEEPIVETEAPDKQDAALSAGRHIFRERSFFFLLLAILAFLGLLLIWPNLNAILAALALVVIIKPLYDWFLKKRWVGGRAKRATGLTMLTFIFVIAIPIILFFWFAFSQANALFTDADTGETFTLASIGSGIQDFIAEISAGDGGTIDRAALVRQLEEAARSFIEWAIGFLGQIAGFVSNFLIGAVIVLVIMMVMLPRFKAPDRDLLATLVPFPPDITQLYMEKIQLMIVGMFKGTFLLAILEGLAMGLVLLVAGVPYAFLLAMVSMLLALLPMIGISLIAWPIGILLLLAGQTWQGIFVILAFVIVVANMDTALRPILVPKGAYLNPALVMLSVFGGLSLMGFIGILYGPVIMILLVTSVEVYTKYIMRSDLEPFLAEDGSLDLEKLGLRATDAETTHDFGISLILQRIAARVSRQENTELS
ncbi:MAG: AI-2E family transporter [Chloroflexota bacterium]|jgi:predicted PurR-regulated permease PerM